MKTLCEATRDQVQNFVTHLAEWAEKDRNALLCQLNSYPHNDVDLLVDWHQGDRLKGVLRVDG